MSLASPRARPRKPVLPPQRAFTRLFALLALVASLTSAAAPGLVAAQSNDPASLLLSRLTPEEKVGQLFLVHFTGREVDEKSAIQRLIAEYHLGGVVLTTANDNFAAENTPVEALKLNNALQQIELESSENPFDTTAPHTYIPLLIGISQEGGGTPNDQILNGLTTIPDQMAIGATWDRQLAEQAGEVMGEEIAALGFNLYLGLTLDVLTLPDPSINADLNTRVFGGDPYWVGEMGRAYLTGLQSGSNGQLAIIAKHFPGRGASDRPSEQEISTVRRSLEELKSIELAPFLALTDSLPENEANVDGLLVSHIRYQGFQGNIRATTRPISFDPQALSQILSLPTLAAWRANGGLVVSDNLGTPAVRRFYDPDLKNFSARLVARDAFLAGNDLLYLGSITSSDAPDAYTSLVRTLDFFTQKYREDPAFASRVDESVRRILKVKYRLYNVFAWETVEKPLTSAAQVGTSSEQVFAIASQSATLISPAMADLASVLPSPPNVLDYIVFLTDARSTQQCSTCPEKAILAKEALQLAIQRLYGPASSGLVISSHLSSFSFDELSLYLDGKSPSADLTNALGRASWVVISTLDLPDGSPQSLTLRRFLSEKQSALGNKKVILFSFSAPYYLDATDISKLTAFYGLYSESDPFVEVAARLLYQEISPAGSLPVSVAGIGYDLISATAPDPEQVISLSLDLPPATPIPEATLTPEPIAAPIFRVGDTISVRTGVIVDHNQRPVPDGTMVRFMLAQGESGLIQQVEAPTTQGVALAAFRLDQPGLVTINATSEPAKTSDTIQLNVTKEGATIIIITPTAEVTPAPPTPTPPVLATPVPSPLVSTQGYPSLLGWLMVVLVMAAGVSLVYWLGSQMVEPEWAIRWALLVLAGGLVTYNYLILGLPGGETWLAGRGLPAFLQAVLVGQGVGFAFGWFWRLTAESSNQAEEQ